MVARRKSPSQGPSSWDHTSLTGPRSDLGRTRREGTEETHPGSSLRSQRGDERVLGVGRKSGGVEEGLRPSIRWRAGIRRILPRDRADQPPTRRHDVARKVIGYPARRELHRAARAFAQSPLGQRLDECGIIGLRQRRGAELQRSPMDAARQQRSAQHGCCDPATKTSLSHAPNAVHNSVGNRRSHRRNVDGVSECARNRNTPRSISASVGGRARFACSPDSRRMIERTTSSGRWPDTKTPRSARSFRTSAGRAMPRRRTTRMTAYFAAYPYRRIGQLALGITGPCLVE